MFDEMPSRAAAWAVSEDPASGWSEAPRKRAKVAKVVAGFGSGQAKEPRRKRRLSWGPSGPPPKLARDAAGQRAELMWELEPRPFQHDASPGHAQLALACICPDPVPEAPPLAHPGSVLPPLVIAPHGGSFPNHAHPCCATRASGRVPLLLADRNVQQSTHRTGPPTIKLRCASNESKAYQANTGTSDGLRSCWIEEIEEIEEIESESSPAFATSHSAGGFGATMDENSQRQQPWQSPQLHNPPDEVSMW